MPTRRVLVVDDDAETRNGIRDLLVEQGFSVECATDGAEALALLRGRPGVSLIFLDLTMPGMNGWEFRRAQLSDPDLASIPLVLTTGHPEYGDSMVALRPDGHLQKPIKPGELFGLLDRFSGKIG
ncbi:MAG: response regulator [Acidobacteria bacterium]|nr:response regulator [Acidobacteriota bacterium]MCA1611043.1 response regulator [Acidobacteriota bacterium]